MFTDFLVAEAGFAIYPTLLLKSNDIIRIGNGGSIGECPSFVPLLKSLYIRKYINDNGISRFNEIFHSRFMSLICPYPSLS